MNNYLDLLAIDNVDIDINILIRPVINNGPPDLSVKINGVQYHEGKLIQSLKINTKMPLLKLLEVELIMSNKQYSEVNETAVIVDSLIVDSIELVNMSDLPIAYTNDQAVENSGFYLGFNGCWRLELGQPFYRWLHIASGQGWLLEPAIVQI
jgi:hypothetical protein